MRSTVRSTAARRASVSRLPSPASTRRRVRSVSSKVMLPELPDARMETRKPIADSSQKNPKSLSYNKTNFQDDGRRLCRRQLALYRKWHLIHRQDDSNCGCLLNLGSKQVEWKREWRR